FGEKSQAMRDAEDKTRLILSEEQRKKYDEILKAHGHHGPPIMRRRPRGNPGPGPQTTSSQKDNVQ
ncbi:MAG TPA: hypothetical protein VGV35_04155, partial [Bryobacteraceae bacterium]|nr:hypothetical protein [Bryobacteraceae bacterium]